MFVLAAPLASVAQPQSAKVPRVGVIYPEGAAAREAFGEGLRERGWIEGRNIIVENRPGEGNVERLVETAAEIVDLKVDVIVASSNPAIAALKSRTRTIPIVMAVVGDPVGAGFIASLSRPGGNITGLSSLAEGLSAKRLEILVELNPRMSRIAVLRNSAIPTHAVLYGETQVAARTMKVTLVPVDFRGAEDFDGAFRTMVRDRVDAFVPLPDPVTIAQRATIVNLAAKHRLAGIYPFGVFVESGGLAAYGPSITDLWRRSAGYVDRILKGARPADLPVQQPTKFELLINMKTAKELGITIPQSVLVRADRVIE